MDVLVSAAWGILIVIVLAPVLGWLGDKAASGKNSPEKEKKIMKYYEKQKDKSV